jgi:hypothetical protein
MQKTAIPFLSSRRLPFFSILRERPPSTSNDTSEQPSVCAVAATVLFFYAAPVEGERNGNKDGRVMLEKWQHKSYFRELALSVTIGDGSVIVSS